jgi:sugar phosphate isomerase/epimerase
MGRDADVKLGLLTATFPELTLEQVAAWAASAEFEALEIACWPPAGGERRRYAGVTDIDVDALDGDAIRGLLARDDYGTGSFTCTRRTWR